MTGQNLIQYQRIARLLLAAILSFSILLGQAVTPAVAANDERALYLYYTHTGETARIVFKRNGQYVQSGLDQMNHMLRDWRKNQPTKMDPHLFDLVWEVYREVGATQPINIVSGFRSPTTNEMLRAVPGSGVAENSQHTKGHAMDFFIPGIPLTKLRATAMRLQVGGVGYYPTSGSPFVHLDTGNVRAWPRMTRAQLAAVFPDGKTLHLPADGKPLSDSGRAYAMAQWTQCHTVPCNGPIATGTTRFASNDTGSGKSLADMLFNGKNNGQQAPATIQVASVPEPALAPTPAIRPANLGGAAVAAAAADATAIPFSTQGSAPLSDVDLGPLKEAPTPALKSQALLVATAATLPAKQGQETALTALAAIGAPVPASRVLMTPQTSDLVTAYAPAPAEPGAERALRTLIARNADTKPQTAVLPPLPGETPKPRVLASSGNVRTASLGKSELTPLVGLFDMTWGAVEETNSKPVADALASRSVNATMRDVDLVAPDLEHVAEVFLTPEVMTSDHYAVIYDHDEADFSPMTELGPYVTHMGIGDEPPEFSFTRFVMNKPLAVASR